MSQTGEPRCSTAAVTTDLGGMDGYVSGVREGDEKDAPELTERSPVGQKTGRGLPFLVVACEHWFDFVCGLRVDLDIGYA